MRIKFLVLILNLGSLAYASAPFENTLEQIRAKSCEDSLLAEFCRAPDDSPEGFGCVTKQLPISPESIRAANKVGVFPWVSLRYGRVGWFSPQDRGILFFSELHIPRKDYQFIRREIDGHRYQVTFDKAFPQVIQNCADMVRPNAGKRVVPWLTPMFVEAYTELFRAGDAHSVEVWRNGELVAGLYGTFINGVFAGESMFHKEDDAAKLALFTLITHLQSKGHVFIDTQQAGNLPRKWGAREIPRDDFLRILHEQQARELSF